VLLMLAFQVPAPLDVIEGFVAGFGFGWLFAIALPKREPPRS
jgi:hypothetical protein